MSHVRAIFALSLFAVFPLTLAVAQTAPQTLQGGATLLPIAESLRDDLPALPAGSVSTGPQVSDPAGTAGNVLDGPRDVGNPQPPTACNVPPDEGEIPAPCRRLTVISLVSN